jgi:hypothetical protein
MTYVDMDHTYNSQYIYMHMHACDILKLTEVYILIMIDIKS